MSRSVSPRRSRRLAPTVSFIALAAFLAAACGATTDVASSAPSAAVSEPTDEGPAPTEAPATADAGTAGAGPTLATLTPAGAIQAALGETPAPECDTSVLTGAGSCVWTAADGSWLKVEESTPQEMPDLESFTSRVTGTLGLDQAVDGIGEAAYVGSSSRGTRIAVYVGDGRVVWAVVNKAGDPATQAGIVKDIATALVAGL